MALQKQLDITLPHSNNSIKSLYHKILNITISYAGAPYPDVLLDRSDDKIWVSVNVASYNTNAMRGSSAGSYNNNHLFIYNFPKNIEITRSILYEKIKNEPLFENSIDI